MLRTVIAAFPPRLTEGFGGCLEDVLNTIEYAASRWHVDVTTLVITRVGSAAMLIARIARYAIPPDNSKGYFSRTYSGLWNPTLRISSDARSGHWTFFIPSFLKVLYKAKSLLSV